MPDGSILRALLYEKARRDEKRECESSLLAFFIRAWREVDPSPFVLNWHHEVICEQLEMLARGEIRDLIINIPPRTGKALSVDTPVLTTWGWKRHGDLKPGDFVFGPDGQPKRVEGATECYLAPASRVEFDDGAKITAANAHEWRVFRDKTYTEKWQRTRSPAIIETEALRAFRPGNYKNEVRPDAIEVALPPQMPPKRLLIDPYVLGVWLGDGAKDHGCMYAGEEDIEHFAAYGRIARKMEARQEGWRPTYRINLPQIQVHLRVLGLLGNKHIPEDYLEAGEDQRWALLQGLMDTDGYVDRRGKCEFTTKHAHISQQVLRLLWSLSIKPYWREKYQKIGERRVGPYFIIGFTPPAGAVVFRLMRKQSRMVAPQNARSRHRYVQSVTSFGDCLVNCVQVEGGIYLAGRELVPTHNSILVSVAFPAWLWCQPNPERFPLMGPQVRFLCVSYGATLAEVAAVKMRRLVMGPWYQGLWGNRVKIMSDQAGRADFGNNAGGERISNSIEGGILGRGGDIQIIDDPHKVEGAESDTERERTLRAIREGLTTRVTDPRIAARVLVMQRLHADDATNYALENWQNPTVVMLPMRYDSERQAASDLDPREDDGELLWPEVWGEAEVSKEERELGSYGTAGQLQQAPVPRGGGIILEQWWQLWEAREFPEYGTCVAALDTAYKLTQEADYNALTVWGAFSHPESGKPKLMLRDAWQVRSTLADLVAKVIETCREHKAEILLIEDSARGSDVADEIYRMVSRRSIQIILVPPAGDKASRLHSCAPLFESEVIFAPDLSWAQMVIDQVATFPRAKHDDLVDTVSLALNYLRRTGVAVRRDEYDNDVMESMRYRKPDAPVYDV